MRKLSKLHRRPVPARGWEGSPSLDLGARRRRTRITKFGLFGGSQAGDFVDSLTWTAVFSCPIFRSARRSASLRASLARSAEARIKLP